jgi:DNA primase large subunit
MRNERESSAAMLAELQKHLRQLLADSDALDLDLKCIHDAVSEILDEDVICSDTNATVRIPFRLVPSLVSKRLVPLEGGLAVIDSGSVRPFLASVFEHFFSASMRAIQAERWVIVQDQRLLDFVNHILITFSRLNPVLSGFSAGCGPPLLSADVQSASADFPPCFANAHQKLTRLHRLGHHARVAYTLFLKEIGQPRAEAVKFWSWHYSRAAASSSSVSCSHSWQKDCKKYTYSIGHLYGVEGARKNYSAHSCRAVKEMGENSPSAALVCPFASYEGAVLERILRASIGDDDVVETLMRTRSHSSNAACRLFLGAKKGEAVAEFAKPSQYYRIATNS